MEMFWKKRHVGKMLEFKLTIGVMADINHIEAQVGSGVSHMV